MKIAVSANGPDLKSIVGESFENSPYLLIIETDDMSIDSYKNNDPQHGTDDLKMAENIINADCEVLITGTIERPAFEMVVLAGVTRFCGKGYRVQEAIRLMDEYNLDFITDENGADPETREERHKHDRGTCDGNTCS